MSINAICDVMRPDDHIDGLKGLTGATFTARVNRHAAREEINYWDCIIASPGKAMAQRPSGSAQAKRNPPLISPLPCITRRTS